MSTPQDNLQQAKNFLSKYTSEVNNLRIQLQDRDAEIYSLKTKIHSFAATALANARKHQTKTNEVLHVMTISKEKLKCQLVKLKRELRDKNHAKRFKNLKRLLMHLHPNILIKLVIFMDKVLILKKTTTILLMILPTTLLKKIIIILIIVHLVHYHHHSHDHHHN